ncbi:DUF1800 family protein [Silanimonas sp.]|uniref:DUF1800 family protein n=1 Tax=Silanimonas sp. TaxID=1929290 RepID=UPI0022BDFF5C|nr:DUF1800 family protein [Silanimonas sp.]MCZ8164837.1 DUF1800 family protein [Silanimonas sp.]
MRPLRQAQLAVIGLAVAFALPSAAQSTFTSTAVVEHSGMCLEVPGASTANNLQLVQNTCNGRPEQSFRFQVIDAARQRFSVVATHSNLCLSANGSTATDGLALIQTACSSGDTMQVFQLERLRGGGLPFRIRGISSARCVEVTNSDTRTSRPVQFRSCQALDSGRNQNWTLAGAATAGFGAGAAPTTAQADAARLLMQATFGPTESEINRVVSLGADAWITDQFNRPASSHLATHQAIHNELAPHLGGNADDLACRFSYACQLSRHDTWWQIGVRGDDQLRQRVAFALSQFFVISEVSDNVGYSQQAISDYYDTLAVHGLGNFRTLLEEVTLHPLMGRYLGMLQNEKADPRTNTEPDENFAREVMQLFSIGLVDLNIDGTPKLDTNGNTIPTYDNTRITNLARALTGWNFSNATSWWNWEDDVKLPGLISNMTTWRTAQGEIYHDTGAKTLLGGTAVPAGGTAAADLRIALDNLFNHPNVGPFLARHLIQRLVTSNPSPAYVRRVAERFNNNGSGVRGDMRAVVRAVLMDPEARDAAQAQQYGYGKVKEPMLRFSAVLRAFNAEGQAVATTGGATTRGLLRNRGIGIDMSQSIMGSPSVFNFYRPNFMPTGELRQRGLMAPELQILNEAVAVSSINHFHGRLWQTDNADTTIPTTTNDPRFYWTRYRFNLSAEKALAVAPEKLVDRMNLLLMGGRMPADMRSILISSTYATPMNDGGGDRVEDLIFLIASSSQFATQR